jgi:YggT family protein
MPALALYEIINLYSFIVVAAVILSWFPEARGHRVTQVIDRVTEPVFALVRRVVPPIGGFDLSALVVLLLLHLLQRLLARI